MTMPGRCTLTALVAAVLTGACGWQERALPDTGVTESDTTPARAEVGGACSYRRLAFRAIVDSGGPNNGVLVRPVDTLPGIARRCHLLRDQGRNHWRVPGPAAGPRATRGDTVEVVGDVIESWTCTPCSMHTRFISRRDSASAEPDQESQ